MSQSRKVVHATAEFVDIAGLQKGSSQGEGLGNRFLGGIREVDAICYVLRAFERRQRARRHDPLDDLATLELELVLADAASAESAARRRRKAARADKSLAARGRRARAGDRASCTTPRRCTGPGSSSEELPLLRPYFLLTAKPILAVVNLGEDQLDDADELANPVAGELGGVAEVLGV